MVKVTVINKHGRQLMPCSPRKARKLLEAKKARVLKVNPFTIKLLYGSTGYVQRPIPCVEQTVENPVEQLKIPKKKANLVHNTKLSYIFRIARKYVKYSFKQALIRKVYRLSRHDGIEYLAGLLGVTPEYIYQLGNILTYKKMRNRARRGRRYIPQNDFSEQISEFASIEAGGGKLNIAGGKRTVHKSGSGNIRSASVGQAWQALMGY